jgi:hypothetical protein
MSKLVLRYLRGFASGLAPPQRGFKKLTNLKTHTMKNIGQFSGTFYRVQLTTSALQAANDRHATEGEVEEVINDFDNLDEAMDAYGELKRGAAVTKELLKISDENSEIIITNK